jgi:hypothetical protein
MDEEDSGGLGMAAMDSVHYRDSIGDGGFPSVWSVVGVDFRNGVFIKHEFDLASDGWVCIGWTWHGGDGIDAHSRLHPQRGFSIALIVGCWRGFSQWSFS